MRMQIEELPLAGAYRVQPKLLGDERGFFTRCFCENEFRAAGLKTGVKQVNASYSAKKGTLRGMHYQLPPFAECKMVTCVQGRLLDVIVDLRRDSETFCRWHTEELSADKATVLYLPEGFAHGFLTLEDDSEALYLVTQFYSPASERGVRYNDPRFGIEWPFEPIIISDKDRSHPDFDERYHLPIS